MSDLKQKAQELRSTLPLQGGAPPAMKGQLLGALPHKDGEIRLSWDDYEGFHFLSDRLWTKKDSGQFWPSKNGFTVKLRNIPALADAIRQAVDLALSEAGKTSGVDATF